ncbi:acyl carrier protein [Amycolatopsis thailandensis]|uniref:acyl carrier protein n=1 Tax=Amycolatopsis thailandensis TaxID=589330 RepID=UPI0037A601F7
MTDTRKAITELLVAEFEVPAKEISDDATLEELGLDSLAQVELGERVTDLSGVAVSDDEVVEAKTVGRLVNLVECKMIAYAS